MAKKGWVGQISQTLKCEQTDIRGAAITPTKLRLAGDKNSLLSAIDISAIIVLRYKRVNQR